MKTMARAICWILLSMLVMSLCACSSKSAEEPGQIRTDTQEETAESGKEEKRTSIAEEASDDGAELKRLTEEFAEIYFSRDVDGIPGFLTVPYEWDNKAVYPFDGSVTAFTIKGLDDVEKAGLGSVQTAWVEFKNSEQDDYYLYLTIEFIKQEDGWKIRFYGLEM